MKSKKRLSLVLLMLVALASTFNCHAAVGEVLVAFVGDSMVGKTCILGKMIRENFDINNTEATICGRCTIHSSDEGAGFRLTAIDISGKERYKPLIPSWVKGASIGVVCASIVSNDEEYEYGCIDHIREWVNICRESISPNSRILIAVNKSNESDSEYCRAQEQKVREIADELSLDAVFVSAKTGYNIQALKDKIIDTCPPIPMQVKEKQKDQHKEKAKECLLI